MSKVIERFFLEWRIRPKRRRAPVVRELPMPRWRMIGVSRRAFRAAPGGSR